MKRRNAFSYDEGTETDTEDYSADDSKTVGPPTLVVRRRLAVPHGGAAAGSPLRRSTRARRERYPKQSASQDSESEENSTSPMRGGGTDGEDFPTELDPSTQLHHVVWHIVKHAKKAMETGFPHFKSRAVQERCERRVVKVKQVLEDITGGRAGVLLLGQTGAGKTSSANLLISGKQSDAPLKAGDFALSVTTCNFALQYCAEEWQLEIVRPAAGPSVAAADAMAKYLLGMTDLPVDAAESPIVSAPEFITRRASATGAEDEFLQLGAWRQEADSWLTDQPSETRDQFSVVIRGPFDWLRPRVLNADSSSLQDAGLRLSVVDCPGVNHEYKSDSFGLLCAKALAKWCRVLFVLAPRADALNLLAPWLCRLNFFEREMMPAILACNRTTNPLNEDSLYNTVRGSIVKWYMTTEPTGAADKGGQPAVVDDLPQIDVVRAQEQCFELQRDVTCVETNLANSREAAGLLIKSLQLAAFRWQAGLARVAQRLTMQLADQCSLYQVAFDQNRSRRFGPRLLREVKSRLNEMRGLLKQEAAQRLGKRKPPAIVKKVLAAHIRKHSEAIANNALAMATRGSRKAFASHSTDQKEAIQEENRVQLAQRKAIARVIDFRADVTEWNQRFLEDPAIDVTTPAAFNAQIDKYVDFMESNVDAALQGSTDGGHLNDWKAISEDLGTFLVPLCSTLREWQPPADIDPIPQCLPPGFVPCQMNECHGRRLLSSEVRASSAKEKGKSMARDFPEEVDDATTVIDGFGILQLCARPDGQDATKGWRVRYPSSFSPLLNTWQQNQDSVLAPIFVVARVPFAGTAASANSEEDHSDTPSQKRKHKAGGKTRSTPAGDAAQQAALARELYKHNFLLRNAAQRIRSPETSILHVAPSCKGLVLVIPNTQVQHVIQALRASVANSPLCEDITKKVFLLPVPRLSYDCGVMDFVEMTAYALHMPAYFRVFDDARNVKVISPETGRYKCVAHHQNSFVRPLMALQRMHSSLLQEVSKIHTPITRDRKLGLQWSEMSPVVLQACDVPEYPHVSISDNVEVDRKQEFNWLVDNLETFVSQLDTPTVPKGYRNAFNEFSAKLQSDYQVISALLPLLHVGTYVIPTSNHVQGHLFETSASMTVLTSWKHSSGENNPADAPSSVMPVDFPPSRDDLSPDWVPDCQGSSLGAFDSFYGIGYCRTQMLLACCKLQDLQASVVANEDWTDISITPFHESLWTLNGFGVGVQAMKVWSFCAHTHAKFGRPKKATAGSSKLPKKARVVRAVDGGGAAAGAPAPEPSEAGSVDSEDTDSEYEEA